LKDRAVWGLGELRISWREKDNGYPSVKKEEIKKETFHDRKIID
jgi:hypothetical protein